MGRTSFIGGREGLRGLWRIADVIYNDGRAATVRNISHNHANGAQFTNYASAPGGSPPAPASTSGDPNNTDYPAYETVNYIIKI